jgi:hypothetical protein
MRKREVKKVGSKGEREGQMERGNERKRETGRDTGEEKVLLINENYYLKIKI